MPTLTLAVLAPVIASLCSSHGSWRQSGSIGNALISAITLQVIKPPLSIDKGVPPYFQRLIPCSEPARTKVFNNVYYVK